jgi:hypothetical protein
VDWQAAFVNDRYFDLSVAANFVVRSEAEELEFLSAYLGHEPNEYEQARFYLMRQAVHVQYAAVFLLLGSGGKALDFSGPTPGFLEFHERIWAGEVSMAGSEMRVVYGRVHLEDVTKNMRSARFREALGVVREGSLGSALLFPQME